MFVLSNGARSQREGGTLRAIPQAGLGTGLGQYPSGKTNHDGGGSARKRGVANNNGAADTETRRRVGPPVAAFLTFAPLAGRRQLASGRDKWIRVRQTNGPVCSPRFVRALQWAAMEADGAPFMSCPIGRRRASQFGRPFLVARNTFALSLLLGHRKRSATRRAAARLARSQRALEWGKRAALPTCRRVGPRAAAHRRRSLCGPAPTAGADGRRRRPPLDCRGERRRWRKMIPSAPASLPPAWPAEQDGRRPALFGRLQMRACRRRPNLGRH